VKWFARLAWLGRVARDVVVETSDGRFEKVTEGATRPPEATELHGIMLPGLANSHSHVFHRALRGRTEGGDFWAWRREMYRLAAALDPDAYFRIARATYAEMALAGVTVVGEFHYLHHPPPGGSRYSDPNEMGNALIRAASEAGVRLTLLDTCYLRGDFDRPLLDVQWRFSDGDVQAWAERVALIQESENVRVGGAIHSVRAVDGESIRTIAGFGAGRPLHVHVSEQPSENERCLSFTGLTPTRLLAEAGVWEVGATAVHATHLEEDDIRLLGSGGAHVCLCPTTERDLGELILPDRERARIRHRENARRASRRTIEAPRITLPRWSASGRSRVPSSIGYSCAMRSSSTRP